MVIYLILSLQASLVSRITAVLPFVPFNEAEQMAIATEAIFATNDEYATKLDVDSVEHVARAALARYIPVEGARSLYRAVSSVLLDMSEQFAFE
jgi:ATP-dependent Clp protease ATP-binding subunit ClpA